MQIPSVCIVILQYNKSEDTIRCLNSVKELDYPNYNVIIVDNGSQVKHIDAIRFFLKNLPPETYNFKLSTLNLGYSGGNNIGIRYALEHGTDYILILNPDTIVEKNLLTKLVKAGESDNKIGIIGPTIDELGKVVYGGKIEWLKPELHHRTSISNDSYVIGACMLIKRHVIEKIGMLDERYFLYFEDADYCMRARKADYKLAVAPEAFIYHKPSSTTSSLGAPLLLRYHYRNAHLFNYKNGPLWVKLALPFWSFFIIIKQFIKIALIPVKREISKAILAGVMDFYNGKLGKLND